MRRLLRALRSEGGTTVVELAVGMVITGLLSTVMVAWLAAGIGSETSHRSYDDAVADLRNVTDQLSRELRGAEHLEYAASTKLSFWLDGDRDGVEETGERITWAVVGQAVIRYTDATPKVLMATNVSDERSTFTYDADDPADVERVTVALVAIAENRAGEDPLVHTVDVYLRNKS